MTEPKKPGPTNVKPSLEEGVAAGRYSNLQIVAMSETEFIFDFGFIQPQEPKGTIHSRVIMSPRRAKALLKALEERIRMYEDRFGEVPLPGASGPFITQGGGTIIFDSAKTLHYMALNGRRLYLVEEKIE